MTKLNVGCGGRKIHGFVNVDIRPDVEPDVVCDIACIDKAFKDVDLIYACHVLEHFPLKASKFAPVTWSHILHSWRRALRSGGTLRLAVPDIKAVIDYFDKSDDLGELLAFFWGGQKYDYDFHYHGWTFETLEHDLIVAGFSDVHRYDWRKTEHHYIDDYSQAYLPHMDKVNGQLLSLNVEARKL